MTEQMTPAEVLAVMKRCEGLIRTTGNHGLADKAAVDFGILDLRQARTAVAALIARNAEMEADAERGRWLIKHAGKKTAHDIYGNGAYWFFSILSDDQRLSFTEVIDAARAEAGHG